MSHTPSTPVCSTCGDSGWMMTCDRTVRCARCCRAHPRCERTDASGDRCVLDVGHEPGGHNFGVEPTPAVDMVNHPPHYKSGGIETIDVIEAWSLGFCLANAVKYISRAGKKPGATELDDCRKAAWYLARHIATIEKSSQDRSE